MASLTKQISIIHTELHHFSNPAHREALERGDEGLKLENFWTFGESFYFHFYETIFLTVILKTSGCEHWMRGFEWEWKSRKSRKNFGSHYGGTISAFLSGVSRASEWQKTNETQAFVPWSGRWYFHCLGLVTQHLAAWAKQWH
jgi:hypothetical protein